jgi:hypothetical protein
MHGQQWGSGVSPATRRLLAYCAREPATQWHHAADMEYGRGEAEAG